MTRYVYDFAEGLARYNIVGDHVYPVGMSQAMYFIRRDNWYDFPAGIVPRLRQVNEVAYVLPNKDEPRFFIQ